METPRLDSSRSIVPLVFNSRGECLGLIDFWRVTRIIRCHLVLVLVEVEGGVYLRLPCKQFPQLLLLLEGPEAQLGARLGSGWKEAGRS